MPKAVSFKDRVIQLHKIPASEVRANPLNWRTHPEAQLNALSGLLSSIGFAGAALAYRDDDGELVLIDGHARQELAGDQVISVLETDLTEDEAKTLLATYDPISAMAVADKDALETLLHSVNSDDANVQAMLSQIAVEQGIVPSFNEAPEDFSEYDEEIETDYCCPKCGYKWSGKPN